MELCGGKIIKEPVMDEITANNEDGLRILQMRVRKGDFNSIVKGETVIFTKDITPKNLSTFFLTNEDGTVKEVNGIGQFKPYDAIQFLNGENSYTCMIDNVYVLIRD